MDLGSPEGAPGPAVLPAIPGARRSVQGREQEPDPGVQLGGGALEGRVPGQAALAGRGIGQAPVDQAGPPGNSGQASRALSHRLIT